MKFLNVLGYGTVLLLGIAMFVYGGYDDSPGGQLLGVIAFGIGTVRLIQSIRN